MSETEIMTATEIEKRMVRQAFIEGFAAGFEAGTGPDALDKFKAALYSELEQRLKGGKNESRTSV